jgi:hypothetical protein
MTHGEKMSVLGKIIALQEVMLHTQNEINKLNKQLQEDENGSNKASTNRDLRTEFNKRGRDNPYLLDEDLIEDKYYAFRGAE